MITIYHNPRCKKSREGIAFLDANNQEYNVIKYLETGITIDTLKKIIAKLNISPLDLVRKTESIWKSDFKGNNMSDNAVLEAMVKHPKLIERPIVINGKNAVIARPTEAILKLL